MRFKSSYSSGLWAEFLARMYLRFHGFKILKSRYVTGRNTGKAEIDIIACRKNLMVFIEVKSRPTIESGFESIHQSQRIRLRRAAELYIARNNWHGDARFDVILVCGSKIYWAKTIF